jgi:hypothetical protein
LRAILDPYDRAAEDAIPITAANKMPYLKKSFWSSRCCLQVTLAVAIISFSGCGGGGVGSSNSGNSNTVTDPPTVVVPNNGEVFSSSESTAMSIDVSDLNGLPITISWTQSGGSTGLSFSSEEIENPTVTVASNGDYIVTVTASNGSRSTSKNITLHVSAASTFALSGTVVDDGVAVDGATVELHWKPVTAAVQTITTSSAGGAAFEFANLIGPKEYFSVTVLRNQ